MKFKLPDLPYDYKSLEPHIDAQTMQIHHQKHHAGYTDKLNAAIEGTDLEGKTIEQILTRVSKYPAAVRNNAGGFYNHNLYWAVLAPGGANSKGPAADTDLHMAITRAFGSFDQFVEQFRKAALDRFGSGWAWLCLDEPTGKLFITSTPNQDNPLMDVAEKQGLPILGIDVWEHAYYLHYQNRRADYVEAFMKLINWKEVNKRYNAAKKMAMTT